jgi:hypothetical protein
MPSPTALAHPVEVVARPAGAAIATLFGALARLLRARPIHPRGVLLDATLVVAEDEAGAAVLPQGRTDALVRVSLGAGMPRGWPDVVGLAVRWHADGEPQDLLLSSSRPGRVLRFAPLPRWRLSGWFSTVMPLRTAAGPALLAMRPDAAATRATGTVTFEVLQATPTGPWQRFAALELNGPLLPGTGASARDGDDPQVRFDPTQNAPRGLGTYRWEDLLRSQSYAAARRGTGFARADHGPRTGPA